MQVNGNIHAAAVLRPGGEYAVPVEWGLRGPQRRETSFAP